MRRILATFSGAGYNDSCAQQAANYEFGADEFWVYDDLWLSRHPFRKQNAWLWEVKGLLNEQGGRGFGLYAWKPLLIIDALSRLDPGDYVCYVDGDTHPIADYSILFDLCRKEGGHLAFMATGTDKALCNRQWCKRECFQCMGLDEERYWNSPAAVARFMVFEKPTLRDIADSERNVLGFLYRWQQHCLDRRCQTFDHDPAIQLPGPVGDGPEFGFREHRTEQAIYSLLCQKYGRRLYREACQFGNQCQQDWDLYPQLFVQHGTHGPHSLKGSKFRNAFPPGGLK